MKTILPAFCIAIALGMASSAFAQTMAPAAPPAKKERSAKSIECSKLADEKGLHGKKRHEFRSKCKHGEM